MIVAFYTARLRTIRYHARQVWHWARKHPRLSVVIVLAVWWTVMVAAGTTAAYADGPGQISLPFLPPTDIQDTHGVSLTQYAILPLDRGDVFSLGNTFIANIIDPIWTGNLVAISWMLWLFQWLLSFEWVSWIATPLNGVATTVHSILSQIGWIPLALAAAGLIGGLVMLSGKYSKGGAEIAISVMCSVLAIGVLSNPVTALTGPNGALHWAESWGANISTSVVGDSNTAPTSTPSTDDASKIISTTITGQLMDIFVRNPSEVIAFGHELTGNCDTVFTEQMKAASPIDTGSTSVRDAVGACDSAAGDYVTHPNFGQVFTVVIVTAGSEILFALGLAMALVLMMCVFYSLWQALKLMIAVYAAVAPGVARQALWNSLAGMYIGAFSVGMSVVLLSVYLKVITFVMNSAAGSQLNIVAQTAIIDLVVLVLIISLFVARHKAKKAGETIAARLARLGFGSPSQPKSRPLLQSAMRTAESYLGRRLAGSRTQPAIAQRPAVKRPATAPVNAGEYTVVGGDRPPTSPTTGAARALTAGMNVARGVSTVAQLAAAASTGGTSAVVMKATTIAGKTLMQRQVNTDRTQPLFPRKTSPAPAYTATPFGRQIVVDKDGVGKIAPREAPRRGSAYNVTTLPRPRSHVQSSPVRAALERAATTKAVTS